MVPSCLLVSHRITVIYNKSLWEIMFQMNSFHRVFDIDHLRPSDTKLSSDLGLLLLSYIHSISSGFEASIIISVLIWTLCLYPSLFPELFYLYIKTNFFFDNT